VLPQLDAAVRRRADRGAKLVVVNAKESRINEAATASVAGKETDALKAILKAAIDKGLKADKKLADAVKDAKVSDEAAQAGELFASAESPVVLASPSLFDAAANLSLAKGTAVAVPAESNAKGVALMGLTTDGKSFKEMADGGVKVLYAVGEVPLKKRPKVDFLVVQSPYMTELAKHADVVLPAATFYESAGTMVDYMGRLKFMPEAVEPRGESLSNKDIFVKVAKAMGATAKKPTEADVKKAAKAEGMISLKPFEAKKADVSASDIIENVNASVLSGPRLSSLKAYAKAAVKA